MTDNLIRWLEAILSAGKVSLEREPARWPGLAETLREVMNLHDVACDCRRREDFQGVWRMMQGPGWARFVAWTKGLLA